jgi:GntR family transcriptional repressor for pyruvate dehydrogenase complex
MIDELHDKGVLRRESLVVQLADRLLDFIIENALDEGDKLPSTSDLAEQFGVSVIVVREAIAILVGRGIVRRQQGRESVIQRPGSEVLDSLFRVRAAQDGISSSDIQQCRSALELQAVALASTAQTREKRQALLRPLLEAMQLATTVEELTRADQAFHEGIFHLSGNRALALIIGALKSSVLAGLDENWNRWFEIRSDDSNWSVIAGHEKIADAIIDGDRDRATQAMAEHFLAWEKYVDFGQLGSFRAHDTVAPGA